MLIIFKESKSKNEAILTIFYTFLFVNTEMMITFAFQTDWVYNTYFESLNL